MAIAVLKVHCTTALKAAIDRLAPSFEATHRVALQPSFGPSGRMAKQVAAGEATDVVIVTGAGIDDLIEMGRVVAGFKADLVGSKIGMAVPKGASRPDIATVDRFKQALLGARAIAMSHPTGGAQSGAHLAKVFEQLGIADAIREKSTYGPGGPAGLVGNFLLRGEADIGLQQLPELMAVPGIDIVGPIPEDLQLVTIFSAGVAASATDPDAARSFISHLASHAAASTFKVCGLEPAFS